jgi:hypothetical protein
MLRNVTILGCCLLLLHLNACNRGPTSTGGRVYYKLEVEGERAQVAIYNVAGNQIRVKIPGRKSAGDTGDGLNGAMTHDGVKYTWLIFYVYPPGSGAVPEIKSVTLNNEVIPKGE